MSAPDHPRPARPEPPVALVTVSGGALAVHEEARRLLALLGEASNRYGAGAVSPSQNGALSTWATSVESDLSGIAAALRETRERLRRAAGLGRHY